VAAEPDGGIEVNLANNLTLFRILLVPVFIGSLFYYSPERAYLRADITVIFLLACLTDGLDGYVARRMNQKTEFGTFIDPIADKLLLLSGFCSLSFMPVLPDDMRIPAWATLVIISRDVIILTGAVVIFMMTGKLKAQPLLIGKTTTVVQMAAIFAALLPAPPPVRSAFFIGAAVLTGISCLSYIRLGGRMLQST
jgi:cardiolipin synthase